MPFAGTANAAWRSPFLSIAEPSGLFVKAESGSRRTAFRYSAMGPRLLFRRRRGPPGLGRPERLERQSREKLIQEGKPGLVHGKEFETRLTS